MERPVPPASVQEDSPDISNHYSLLSLQTRLNRGRQLEGPDQPKQESGIAIPVY